MVHTGMLEKVAMQLVPASLVLAWLLKKEKLCVWPVNKASMSYKLGLLLGVTLSWPGDEEVICQEIKKSAPSIPVGLATDTTGYIAAQNRAFLLE
jgi:hypothetical protein